MRKLAIIEAGLRSAKRKLLRFRDAITGRFVSRAEAERRPDTTVGEKRK